MHRLSDYTYELPESLIAQTPLEDRAASRLLHLDRRSGTVRHLQFRQCADLLQPGDLLVLNDTRVSAVRLLGRKPTGGEVECLLLHGHGNGRYLAMVRPGRRMPVGAEVRFEEGLVARVTEVQDGGLRMLDFGRNPTVADRLARLGQTPLPPYIHEELADSERYQTTYGVNPGSAAAPTAGLHFTPEILNALREKGVQVTTVTLHVSIDTFRPVTVENLDDHRMHGEECLIPVETAQAVNDCRGRIIAVGTTTVRTLETFAEAPRRIRSGQRRSELFIRPGFQYKIIDGMFTNFHLPGTTMMLMISALAGRDAILAAYEQAVREEYRFLSFGDSMLIL